MPNVSFCNDDRDIHYNPYVDPYGGHDYVEIGGLKWATMNVGANSITDYGLYFQWGDTQGYTFEQVGTGEGQKLFDSSDYKYYDSSGWTKYKNRSDILEPSDDAVTAAWGGNWRLPTANEFRRFINLTTSSTVEIDGVEGFLFTAKDDNSKTLFFPRSGAASYGVAVRSGCYYWTNELSNNDASYPFSLEGVNNPGVNGTTWSRPDGLTARGVYDETL